MGSKAQTTAQNVQYAALPWRATPDGLEILLITTLNTRRWIIPKGWPLDGLAPHDSAAREALEEAGICGTIAADAFGSFSYEKIRKSGQVVTCNVSVFPMHVEQQRKRWIEKGAREMRWCKVEEALELVSMPELSQILAQFARSQFVIQKSQAAGL
jgi:8-oxo-dGTP pyrophosphatase MutT (NUDIX family)